MSHSLEQIGRIVGEATPESFIFVSRKDLHPPKYEYVSIISKELVHGKIKEVMVLAQVVGIFSRSDAFSSGMDYETLEKIFNAGIDDTNVLCKARTLGYMVKKGQKKQVYLPRRAIYPGNPVYIAPDDLVKEFFSYSEDEGLHIGYLIARPSINVHISVNGFRRHVAIIAQTGAGKSYTVGVILEELLKKGGTAIVIDPHADYVFLGRTKDMLKHEYSNRIQIFRNPNSTGRYSEKDIDNLRELTFRFSDLDEYDIAKIAGIPEIWTNIIEAIKMAIEELRAGDGEKTYSVEDLMNKLEEMSKSRDKVSVHASKALNHVKRLRKFKVFGNVTTPIKGEILKPFHISIIDLSGLNDASQDYIVGRILEEVMRLKTQGEFDWPIFIFLEEAHRFIPNGKRKISSSIINTIAAEGRKFGVFLTLITQRPSKVDPDSLSQCNSQIILRITNPKDQNAVQDASERLGRELMNDLPGLNVGEAIVVGDLSRVPVMLHIRERISAEGGADIDLVKELRRARELLQVERSFGAERPPPPKGLRFSEV